MLKIVKSAYGGSILIRLKDEAAGRDRLSCAGRGGVDEGLGHGQVMGAETAAKTLWPRRLTTAPFEAVVDWSRVEDFEGRLKSAQ